MCNTYCQNEAQPLADAKLNRSELVSTSRSYVGRNVIYSYMNVTRPIHIYGMTHSYVWYDSF